MGRVNFFCQDIDFSLKNPRKTKSWILQSIRSEKALCRELNFIFCSDNYLLEINQHYLNHDYFTDIVTFDNSEEEGCLEGDIYISIDRVEENAKTVSTDFDSELHRVMIHGVLHLLGFSDKTKAEKQTMRKKEDAYLSLR